MGRILFFLLAAASLLASSAALRKLELSEPPSAYDLLGSYGFPAGLLPHTVVDYDLQSNGRFSLKLNKTCSALLQGTYLLNYESQISGLVSPKSIKSLKGVTVRAFFLDWAISGVRVNHDDLVFEVGFASARFPLSNFLESPQCEEDQETISSV